MTMAANHLGHFLLAPARASFQHLLFSTKRATSPSLEAIQELL